MSPATLLPEAPTTAAADRLQGVAQTPSSGVRKGTNGVSTNAVTAISFYVFDRGIFVGTPVNLLLSSQSVTVYLFPNLSKLITFAAAPLVLTPSVRNQGVAAAGVGALAFAAGAAGSKRRPLDRDGWCSSCTGVAIISTAYVSEIRTNITIVQLHGLHFT